MKITNSVKNFLDFFDIFRLPVTLFFNRSEKSSTTIGKVITFCIFGFLLFFFSTSDLLTKRSPYIFGDDLKMPERPTIYLSKANFTFAIGLANIDNTFISDPSLFYFVLYIVQQFSNGSANYKDYILNPCQPEDFPPNYFDRLGLNGTYCLPNMTLKLEGYWNEESLSYFFIQMRQCQNSSNSGVICKQSTDIQKKLKALYVDIYIENPILDLSDYLNPFKQSIDMIYQRMSMTLMKTIEIYLKSTSVFTDHGYFFENNEEETKFVIGNYLYDVNDITDFNDDNLFLYNINVYSSDHRNRIIRKYQKLQDILAQFGGVCNVLAIIGILVAKIEYRFNFSYFAMNKLYNFQLVTRKKTIDDSTTKIFSTKPKKNLGKWKPKIEMGTEINIDNFTPIRIPVNESPDKNVENLSPKKNLMFDWNMNNDKSPLSPSSKMKKTFKERFNKMFIFLKNDQKPKELDFARLNFEKCRPIYEKTRLKFSFWNYLKLLAKKKKYRLSIKEKCFVNAESKLLNDLDVINIIKKFQDIEKLKKILLTEKQLYFFEMLTNPTITPAVPQDQNFSKEEIIEMKSKFNPMATSIQRRKFNKFVERYSELKISSESNFSDKKILDLLDEELIKSLDNQQI